MSKLKVVGVALVAVTALSALMASSAFAGAGRFTSAASGTAVTGEQVSGNKHVCVTDIGSVRCEVATFTGTTTGTSTEMQTMSPK